MHHRVFPCRSSIELAAEGVEDLGYLAGAETRAALEQEMLDEVTDAVLRRFLVTGAGTYPEAQRY
jgi:hypothetical protein